MKRKYTLFILIAFACSCQSLKRTTVKGTFFKRINRVTPKDIQAHTQKIFVNKYQYVIERSSNSRSAIYYETSWKNLKLTPEEKEKGISDVRVRFKIRSRETRTGGSSKYNVHSLKFIAEVETYHKSGWIRTKITPQLRDYIEGIYDDYKLEFKTGIITF